jgi:hypothetical protein
MAFIGFLKNIGMSSTIAYVVYGISFAKSFTWLKNDINILNDDEIATSYYNLYTELPICLGVRLCSFYESEHAVDIASLTLSPTDGDVANFSEISAKTLSHPKISVMFKKHMLAQIPKTFIIWGYK